jgi:hypothetical protein
MTEGPAMCSFRALQAGGQSAAVLNNWGAAGRATVQFPDGAQSVMELLSGASIPLRRAGATAEASVEIKDGASAVLLAR